MLQAIAFTTAIRYFILCVCSAAIYFVSSCGIS